jgi:anti-sigma regulatory factor (Ser/Thr protein kinase)
MSAKGPARTEAAPATDDDPPGAGVAEHGRPGSDLPEAALIAFVTSATGPRPWHRAFPGEAAQAASARRFIRRVLGACPAAADAEALTSELFANSVRHSRSGRGGVIHVLVSQHLCPGVVRVAVIDAGAVTGPVMTVSAGPSADTATLDTGGRGLAIVAAVASRSGHHGDERSRVVWFDLRCDQRR